MEIDKVFHGDCMDLFRTIPDESVDLVVTDPPYNVASEYSLTKQGDRILSTKEAWGQWDTYHKFDYDLLIMRILTECYRVLKKGGSMYMFTANRDNGYFMRKAQERGFTCRNQLAIIKKNPLPQYKKNNWRSAYELCMYLTKGRAKTFNFLSQRNCVNTYPYVIGRKQSKHPTEKPLGFIKRLVQVSSRPGDIVLDPFMGSGTTAVACKESGRHFIGAETSSDYIKMIDKRLVRARSTHYSDGLATEKQKVLMKRLGIEFSNSITKKTAFERIRQRLG